MIVLTMFVVFVLGRNLMYLEKGDMGWGMSALQRMKFWRIDGFKINLMYGL